MGVVGAKLDSLFKFFDLEESTLFAGACAAFDTAFKHLSNFDSIAATLAAMGLGSLEHKSTLSGEVAKLAALLQQLFLSQLPPQQHMLPVVNWHR